MPVHLADEPKIPDLASPLVILVAANHTSTMREHLAVQPYTEEEHAAEIIPAIKAGASMWHLHIRNPKTGDRWEDNEMRVQVHKKTCDLVFKECPDVITDPNIGGGAPIRVREGPFGPVAVPESLLAENRLAKYVEPLLKAGGGTAKYVQSGILNIIRGIGGTEESFKSECKWLQDHGVKPELGAYNVASLADTKEWFIDTGIAEKPYFIVFPGIHTPSTPIVPTWKGVLDNISQYLALPPDSAWGIIAGGRNYMPIQAAFICMGCDFVRVGMEDMVYKYPHRDDKIVSCEDEVKRTVQICEALGRPVATPAQARRIIGIKYQPK